MDSSLITLIINAVLGVFMLLGFLGGLKGLKKSTFNLVVFAITILLAFFLTPVFSNIALNIVIQGQTINGHIQKIIYDAVGADMASSDFVVSLVEGLPPMIVNIVVNILLVLGFGLILRIIGAIVYKIIFKKDKKKVVEKCELVNGSPQMVKTTVKKKKKRLLGGLVGAAHGALLAFVLFFPICGVFNIFNDVIGTNKASAETTAEIKYFDEMIQENLPKDVLDIAKAVDDSILVKIGSVANISETSFNLVCKNSINGFSIRLGEEVRTLVKAYNSFVDFALSSSVPLDNYSFENIFNDITKNPQNYDFNKLDVTLNALFESNLINATGKDALKLVGDVLVDNATEENLVLMNHVKSALYSYAGSDAKIKDDVMAFADVVEIAIENDILDTLNDEYFEISMLSDILLNEADVQNNKPENEVLNQITTKLSSSTLLQKFILEFTNYGIGELEKEMKNEFEFSGTQQVKLTTIDSTKDYRISANELNTIFIHFIDVCDEIESLDINAIQEDAFAVFDADVKSLVSTVGNLLNDVVSISILKDTGVFNSICDQMARTEYNNYISFNTLKQANTIKTQFGYLAESVGAIKDSGIISDIRYVKSIEQDGDYIKSAISKLAEKEDGTTPYIEKIVAPLLKCNILKNALEYGLDEAHKYVEQELIKINENASLNNFNTSNLMTDTENSKFIILLNNLVDFANGVDVSKLLTNEFIDELLSSDDNIANLGKALDSVKDSTLFKDYNNQDGVYKNLMDALAGYEVFNEFFDFNVAKQDNFSWNSTTQNLITLKQELDNVYVDNGGEQVKLLKYILTAGDYNALVDSLYGKTINLTKLFELDVLKPTSVKVINIINTTIKDFIDDETLTANIVDIDLTANIAYQAQNINDVINKALQIDFDYVSEVGIENISETEMAKINALLAEMEINSNLKDDNNVEIGVFKESYKALVKKVIVEINKAVAEETGIEYVDQIIEEIPSLEEITPVLEKGQKVFELLDENTNIEDIQQTQEFDDFMSALQENEHTQDAYDKIQEYLASLK